MKAKGIHHVLWMSKGLQKSSKQKQKLYIKFLKDKSIRNEQMANKGRTYKETNHRKK